MKASSLVLATVEGTTPVRTGRRIVVVDIENLIGGAVLTTDQVAWSQAQLAEAIGLDDTDQVVIGLSHIGLLTTATTWRRQRYVVQSGDNGADLALLEVLAENLDRKYDEVLLVSGDGIFTDAIANLAAAGVHTHVIAPSGTLSRRLRMAANTITVLPNQYSATAVGGVA